MLSGTNVALRAMLEEDMAILHTELYEDIATHMRADTRPWVPKAPGQTWSPYVMKEPPDHVAPFAVVAVADGGLVGECIVWGIDLHNRFAHLGISLRPSCRGQGFGVETLGLMCRYGFRIRGLHRLQLETLADNAAMQAAAERAGFQREGVLREVAFVDGRHLDEAVFGLLAADWVDA